MPYTLLLPSEALCCKLPGGGMQVQTVGLLTLVDAEDSYAELEAGEGCCLPLLLNLVPADDMPAVAASVHVFGLLYEKSVCGARIDEEGQHRTGAAQGAAPQQVLQRVLKVDFLRKVPGLNLNLLVHSLKTRGAICGAK